MEGRRIGTLRYRVVKAPSPALLRMLARRASPEVRERIVKEKWDAVALVMDNLPNLFFYADVAEKRAKVLVEGIWGICPQHFTMIAILGDTASVEAAINAILEEAGRLSEKG